MAGLAIYNIEYLIFVFILALMLLIGTVLFIMWLVRTKIGTNSLVNVSPKNNLMDIGVVMSVFGIWIFTQLIISFLVTNAPFMFKWQDSTVTPYFSAVISALITIVAILLVAKKYFDASIKGFGLDIKTLWDDIRLGLVNYLAIFPVVILLTILVDFIGNLVAGPDFRMPNHSLIEMIEGDIPIWITIFAISLAAVVAPIVEELLFRGILQNYMFSLTGKPWLSIFITSLLFAMVHGFTLKYHWPALFVLSCCMGYAYAKSGSLFRSMLVHTAFNSVSVASALITTHFGHIL